MVLFDNIVPQNGAGNWLSVFFLSLHKTANPAEGRRSRGGPPRTGPTVTRRRRSGAGPAPLLESISEDTKRNSYRRSIRDVNNSLKRHVIHVKRDESRKARFQPANLKKRFMPAQ